MSQECQDVVACHARSLDFTKRQQSRRLRSTLRHYNRIPPDWGVTRSLARLAEDPPPRASAHTHSCAAHSHEHARGQVCMYVYVQYESPDGLKGRFSAWLHLYTGICGRNGTDSILELYRIRLCPRAQAEVKSAELARGCPRLDVPAQPQANPWARAVERAHGAGQWPRGGKYHRDGQMHGGDCRPGTSSFEATCDNTADT